MSRNAGMARRLAPWISLAVLIILADQASKFWITQTLTHGERRALTPFFDLTLTYNRGAAFSFLSDASGWQRWFFIGIGCAAAVFIVVLLARHGSQRLFAFSLSMILGGALGNVIDRIIHGQVVDFLLLYWRGWFWPAFNLADSAIVGGAILLVLDELLRVRKSKSY